MAERGAVEIKPGDEVTYWTRTVAGGYWTPRLARVVEVRNLVARLDDGSYRPVDAQEKIDD